MENETLPSYVKRNLNHWFSPAEQIISMDRPIESPDGATGAVLFESGEPSPEALVVSQQDRENIAAWLNLLLELQNISLMRRFGLDGSDC